MEVETTGSNLQDGAQLLALTEYASLFFTVQGNFKISALTCEKLSFSSLSGWSSDREPEENLLIIKSDESTATPIPDHRWDRFTRRYFPYFCFCFFPPLQSLAQASQLIVLNSGYWPYVYRQITRPPVLLQPDRTTAIELQQLTVVWTKTGCVS